MSPSSFQRLLLLASVLPAFAIPASGQTSATAQNQSPATLKLTTRLVILDVVVTDAKGDIVHGLTRDDFTLLEAGKPRVIRSFDVQSGATMSASGAGVDPLGRPDWGSAPLNIFVLDDLDTPFDEKAFCAFTLKRYLQQQGTTLESPSALLLVNDKAVRQLADFTRSRDALITAIEKRPGSVPNQLNQSNDTDLLAESFAALHQISLSLGGYSQHKNLVWLGRGFPAVDLASMQGNTNANLKSIVQHMVSELQDARITVYKVDPITADAMSAPTDLNTAIAVSGSVEGNASVSAPSENPTESNFNFNAFAASTGGSYFYGRNDLEHEIAQSLERGRDFYTLTYVPSGDAESYHPIQIKLRNPALHAITRQGYFASAPPSQVLSASISPDLTVAASSRLAYSGVATQISGITRSADGKAATIKLVIEDRGLAWEQQASGSAYKARIRLVAVALDGDHTVQHTGASSLTLSAASADEVSKGLLRTDQSVAINAQTRFVRLLVEDTGGHLGSAEVELPSARP